MATVQSWVCSRSGRVAWIAPLPFKALISTKRDQRGRRFTFTKTAERTYTHCFSHTRTMSLQSKHNICSSQKTNRCQKHVQNKIAWRHQSKKEIKKRKTWKSKPKKSLLLFDIECFLWPVLLFSDQAQSWTQSLTPCFCFFFFTAGHTITQTLKSF